MKLYNPKFKYINSDDELIEITVKNFSIIKAQSNPNSIAGKSDSNMLLNNELITQVELNFEAGQDAELESLEIGDVRTIIFNDGVVTHKIDSKVSDIKDFKTNNIWIHYIKFTPDVTSYDDFTLNASDPNGVTYHDGKLYHDDDEHEILELVRFYNKGQVDDKVDEINEAIDKKQDVLTAGENITIEKIGEQTVISAEGGQASSEWGSITGTLSDQTDLQEALDEKVNTSDVDQSPTQNTIAQRGPGGRLNVGTPTGPAHATTKTYVDEGLAIKQNITDNALETTDKTIVGAINEVNAKPSLSYSDIYPMGSVYITTDPEFDPSFTFGDFWVLIENGRFLEATTNRNPYTFTKEPGLPNISGIFSGAGYQDDTISGAFVETDTAAVTLGNSGNSRIHYYNFDASESNSIYGASTTVQPKSRLVYMWEKVDKFGDEDARIYYNNEWKKCSSLKENHLCASTSTVSIVTDDETVITRASFNHKIKLNPKLNGIPSEFLKFCTQFNQPIILPESILYIDDDFLYGATNFNQQLIFPNKLDWIGRNFLYDDTQFNQPITLPNSLTSVGAHFLYYGYDMISTVNIQDLKADIFETGGTLGAYLSHAPMYTIGVTIIGTDKANFLERFPNDDPYIYRHLK